MTTNEEKIKAMSREELAEFIADIYHEGACFVDAPYCKEPCTRPGPCHICAEEWLGKEAKE